MPFNKVMTTKELAEYIRLNEKTVIKMAQSGELPGIKIGSQWRFHLSSIDAYLQKDVVQAKDSNLDLLIQTDIHNIPLSRVIREDLIEMDLKARKGRDVLKEFSEIAVKTGLTQKGAELLKELLDREELLSTAIGKGTAIPHPRHPEESLFKKPNIILGRSVAGIDFNAQDKKPVHLFFLICSPNEFVHIRLLAKISKLFHVPGILEKFKQAQTSREIIQILLGQEQEDFLKGTYA